MGVRAGIALTIALLGCKDPPPPPAPLVVAAADAARATPQAPSDTHAKMVARLAGISARTDVENPYLGRAEAERFEAELSRLPAAAPVAARYTLRMNLGTERLELGETRAAIRHLEAALKLAPRLDARMRRMAVFQTRYWLGVAWMRLGETENCAQLHTGESCILPIRGGGVHRAGEGSRAAIAAFTQALEEPADPATAVAARWLLNIAYQTLGEYPDQVPEPLRVDPARFRSPPAPAFTDVAPAKGLAKFDLSGGAVVDDFDGDGWLDIITSSWDTRERLSYWRNHGDGRFTERGVAAGFEGILGGLNLIHADYDNDGDLDLFVLRGAWLQDAGRHPNSLLRNDGRGVFRDVTFAAGLAQVDHPTQTAVFGDFDLDGDLDLYVGNEARNRREHPAQLFRNEGDGTFVDVAEKAGVQNWRYAKGVVFGDYDGDRWPDLYVSNMGGPNRLYRNRGDGTFEDVAARLGVTAPHIGFPAWFWDFDNDGALDILALNGYAVEPVEPPVWNVAAEHMGLPHKGAPMRLYRNDGDGGFSDVAAAQGLARHTTAMGCNFGDLDNDGRLDLYLGTGYPQYEGLMPNLTFRNRGDRFEDVTFSTRMAHLQKGHGVSFADLDQDGDQDVFVQLGGAFPGDKFGNALFRNPGGQGNWLVVTLRGQRSNRSAIGARLTAHFTDGEARALHRRVNTGGSFGGNPLRQHLGLGAATKVDRLEVYWPASDTRQVFRDLVAGQHVFIEEGVPQPRFVEYPSFSL